MSLYNQLHGFNPAAAILLKIIEIDQPGSPYKSGRFRDIHLNADGTLIILYTRNGGGNRAHYSDERGALPGRDCSCTGCIAQYLLPSHPLYIKDYDDQFDATYAYFEFKIPAQFADFCKRMSTGFSPETIGEKFQKTMKEMENMTPEQMRKDARFAPTVEMLDKIASTLEKK